MLKPFACEMRIGKVSACILRIFDCPDLTEEERAKFTGNTHETGIVGCNGNAPKFAHSHDCLVERLGRVRLEGRRTHSLVEQTLGVPEPSHVKGNIPAELFHFVQLLDYIPTFAVRLDVDNLKWVFARKVLLCKVQSVLDRVEQNDALGAKDGEEPLHNVEPHGSGTKDDGILASLEAHVDDGVVGCADDVAQVEGLFVRHARWDLDGVVVCVRDTSIFGL